MATPEEAAAIAAAKGALGEKLSKFPLLFARAVFFGPRPKDSISGESKINSATATLVDLGSGHMAITCHHVLKSFRQKRAEDENLIFQMGDLELDIEQHIIAESEALDLVTIRVDSAQAKELNGAGEIGSCFYEPPRWPPQCLCTESFVSFGGFPGQLRTVKSFDTLEFPSWSCGASEVSSVSEQAFYSAFDRDYWVVSYGDGTRLDIALGGLSGGPAFVDRGMYFEFAGIVTDHQPNYDAMRFTKASYINPDGSFRAVAI